MTRRRDRLVVVSVVLALLGVAGCGDGSEEATPSRSDTEANPEAEASGEAQCDAAVESIISATERYVSSYEAGRDDAAPPPAGEQAAATTTTVAEPADTGPDGDLRDTLAAAEGIMRSQRCDPNETRSALDEGLGQVAVEGPVADAVLRQLTASLTGRAANEPGVRTVSVGEDLRDVLAESADGSTIQLEAGEHRLDGSLVLLTEIVIRGAGRDATTIVSTAPDAAVLAVTDQRVELAGLTVRHEGADPASAVLGGPAASVVVSDARLSGGTIASDGYGGAGILMYDSGEAANESRTTLEVTNTELRDNQGGGIVLIGGHRSSIVGATFASNGQCGLCYLGASTGSVEDSTFEANSIGVAVAGTASPTLLRLVIRDGEVGIQAGDEAAPTIQTATISGSARAAIILTGNVSGSLDEVTCEDVPFGIVVSPTAHPQIGDVDCDLASTP